MKNRKELFADLPGSELLCSRPCNDDDIARGKRDFALVVSEPFAYDPFDSVALHSTPEPLLDHKAKAMMFQGVRNEVQTKMGSFRAFSRFLDPLKIGGNANSFVRPERVVAPQRDSSSMDPAPVRPRPKGAFCLLHDVV